MVARFHEGCLHRRVDGQIEEFIFTDASSEAVTSWAAQIERMMAYNDHPHTARWLLDLRLSGPLPVHDISHLVDYLLDCPGTIGKQLRIAYLTDAPEIFETLFSALRKFFHIETRARWFNTSISSNDLRPAALQWLMQNE